MSSSKHRMLISSIGIILLLFGGFLIAAGDQVIAYAPHTFPTASAFNYQPSALAVTCTGQGNDQICGPDTDTYPNNAWHLRWGQVTSGGPDSFYWNEYWYTSYRFMQKFDTNYGSAQSGQQSALIGPQCAQGTEDSTGLATLDQNGNNSPCIIDLPPTTTTTGAMGTGAYGWLGFIATRQFSAGAPGIAWTSGPTHVHAEFTFDDFIKLEVNINNAGWTVAQGTAKDGSAHAIDTTVASLPLANQPLSWDYNAAASDVIQVRVIWAQFLGSAVINNSWDFGPQAPACNLGQPIFSYDLVDGTHDAANKGINIASATATYNVNPTFTINANLLQSGCGPLINANGVGFSLQTQGYTRTIAYTATQSSPTLWTVQIGPLSPGTYYLNAGVATSQGTWWALSLLTMSFVSPNAVITIQGGVVGNILDWFTPIRDLGILLSIVGLATIFFSFPMKKP